MPTAISVKGLRKTYGNVEAVSGVDLEVQEGEIFALLGPNGAGKTTTVEILEGHRKRTSGEVSVLGFDPGKAERAFKERIGIVLQETSEERFLTVAEVIDLYRSYYPHPRPRGEVLEVVGMTDRADIRVGKLSGGQLRRLDVAIGLCGDPDLLFLDEPTTGFDPSARRGAWEMVRTLKELGKTVFLTTHYMDEAEHLSDRVAIIAAGAIITVGKPGELAVTRASTTLISFRLPEERTLPSSLGELQRDGHSCTLETADPVQALHELTGWALREGVELQALSVARPSLEDVYLDVTRSAGGAAPVVADSPRRRRRRGRR